MILHMNDILMMVIELISFLIIISCILFHYRGVCLKVLKVSVTPVVDVCEVFEIPEFDVSDVPEVLDVTDVFDVPEVYPEMLHLHYVIYI